MPNNSSTIVSEAAILDEGDVADRCASDLGQCRQSQEWPPTGPARNRNTRKQVHFRASEAEYRFLIELADREQEAIGTLLRRLIRSAMKNQRPG